MNALYFHSESQHKKLVIREDTEGKMEYTYYCECPTKQGMIIKYCACNVITLLVYPLNVWWMNTLFISIQKRLNIISLITCHSNGGSPCNLATKKVRALIATGKMFRYYAIATRIST